MDGLGALGALYVRLGRQRGGKGRGGLVGRLWGFGNFGMGLQFLFIMMVEWFM